MDGLQQQSRSPLHAVWYPETDWGRMRRDLERGLVGDVRFAARGAGVMGVVSWIGGMPGARRELEQAVKNSNEVPAAHAALAQLMLARGDVDAARFHASAVLAAQQDRAVIRAIKGRAMAGSGEAAGGEAELNKALQDDSSNPGVWRHVALTRDKAGDVPGAVEAWREVLRLSPGDVGARNALLALEKGGR
jgi:predicted Zn-dependent protease